MSEIERFECGDTRQFTLTLSVAPDGNPIFAVYNGVGTLISSINASQSGATYNYYSLYTTPASVGFYKYEWNASVSSKAYLTRGQFELVLTETNLSGYYCTPTDLRNMYKKLETSGLTNTEINEFIADADQEINLILSNRYSVPFATGANSLPSMVGVISKNLSLCNIVERQVSQGTGDVPEWITAKRERMEKYLEGLAVGSYTLVTSAGDAISVAKEISISPWSNTQDMTPIFSLLATEEAVVDPDLIDEEEDLRA